MAKKKLLSALRRTDTHSAIAAAAVPIVLSLVGVQL